MEAAAPIESRETPGHERLIVVNGDSAAGAIRQAAIADRVLRTTQELVWGPVPPQDEPMVLLRARFAAWNADPTTSDRPLAWEREALAPQDARSRSWEHDLPRFADHRRIELWMDPGPNAQLQLLQLLDFLGRHRELADKVFLMLADGPLGECAPAAIHALQPRVVKATPAQFELATRAWHAFREPTPQAWFALLRGEDDLLRHRPARFWWGGTAVRGERPWRWDAAADTLRPG